MKLFSKNSSAVLTMGAAMMALVGKATVTGEEAQAANGELAEAGISGAQLINEAAFNELTEKAGRVDTAEKAVTAAQESATAAAKVTSDALAAAGAESIEALVQQRDAYKVKADKFDKLPGAGHTGATLKPGTTDVEQGEPDANQQAIDELPHNQALDNHPLFGKGRGTV